MGIKLNALIVEDSHSDYLLLLRALRKSDYDIENHIRVDSAIDMQNAINMHNWDIIISDYSMPNFSAIDALKLIHKNDIDIPFIIVSGTVGEQAAISAMKAGAHDFFPKGNFARLGVAVERELREAQVRRERIQAEQRFTQAFLINPSSICITDLETDTIQDVNPSFIELFGYSREEVIKTTTFDLNLWHDKDIRKEHIKLLLTDQRVHEIEIEVQSRSGSLHHVLVSCEVIKSHDDTLIMTFMHDITERKQAENELRAVFKATSVLFKVKDVENLGHQLVQAVVDDFNQFDCGLILMDTKRGQLTQVAYASSNSSYIPSYEFNDNRGLIPHSMRMGDLIYAADVSLDERYVSNNPTTQSELVIPLNTNRGVIGVLDLQSNQIDAFSERNISVLTIFAEQAALVVELMILYEEIHRYASELEDRVAIRTLELERAKEEAEAIIKNSSDGIALIDQNAIIQQTNLSFRSLFDHVDQALTGHSFIQLFDETQGEKIKAMLYEISQTGHSERLELTVDRETLDNYEVDLALTPILSSRDDNMQFVCSLRDISARKKIEQQLKETLAKEKELSELKLRFISIVSHEFRTPLAIMQTSVDILSLYAHRLTTERQVEHLTKIQEQIINVNDMIDDVLVIGTNHIIGTKFQPKLLNPRAVCEKIKNGFQATLAHHVIRFNITGQCKTIRLDHILLNHILTNLLSNAAKYSPESDYIYFDLRCYEDHTEFVVRDTGIGIPTGDIKHLFDEFHRADNAINIKGTGLGLSVVHTATQAHGGKIKVESIEGSGATFMLTLPNSAS